MDRAQLLDLLRANRLERVAASLLALARDSIALERTPVADSAIRVGPTKLGGAPDLPASVAWPMRAGIPYSFLCQVACAEAAAVDPTGLLPQSGMLSFFVLLTEENYWDFPLVLYHDSMALQRAPLPTWPPGATSTADTFFAELVFPTCAVTLVRDVTLADGAAARVRAVGMTDEESTRYWDLTVQSGPAGFNWSPKVRGFVYPPLGSPADRAGHHLFGNAVAVQGERCVPGGPDDWQVLLQLASDYHARFCWGDLGILTWSLKAEAFRRRDFAAATFAVDMG